MEKTREKIIVDQFSDGVNTFTFNQENFNAAMNSEHRTLQQSMARAVLGWLESVHEKEEKFFDGRNIGMKKTADKLIGEFKKNNDGIEPSKFLGFI